MSSEPLSRVVKAIHPQADDLIELVLERDGMPFEVGDCLALGVEEGTAKPYSIASGIHEDELRFLIRSMPGGEVSPNLAECRPGESVFVSEPFGWFRPGHDIGENPFVFIATGTGIAPFLAFRHSFPEKRPAAFIYGVRTLQDAFHWRDLSDWGDLQLAVSRESCTDHFNGRVTELFDTLPLGENVHYYLCGLDAMIDEMTARLQQKGINLSNIHREVFFYSS